MQTWSFVDIAWTNWLLNMFMMSHCVQLLKVLHHANTQGPSPSTVNQLTFSGGFPTLLPISFQSFRTSSTLDTNLKINTANNTHTFIFEHVDIAYITSYFATNNLTSTTSHNLAIFPISNYVYFYRDWNNQQVHIIWISHLECSANFPQFKLAIPHLP